MTFHTEPRSSSASRLFFVITLIAFISEALIMVLLRSLIPRLEIWAEAVLDAGLLVGLLTPALYFFMVHPLDLQIAIRRRSEAALQEAHDKLEQRVQERTAELTGAVDALYAEVAERKRVEEALRQSEHKLRSIVDNSEDGIVLVDERGAVLEWNQGQEQITGVSEAEAFGQYIWDIQYRIAPDEQKTPTMYEQLKAFMLGFLSTGQLSPAGNFQEQAIQRLDGPQRVIQSLISPIRTEHGLMAVSITRDITERIQAEKEREQLLTQVEQARQHAEGSARETQLANNLLRTLIDTMPAGVIVADASGAIVLTNQAARDIMGGAITGTAFSPRGSYMLYRVDGALLPPDDLPLSRSLRRNETTKGIEAFVRRHDGQEVAILMAASPVCDASGNIISGIAIFQDITDRKRIEQALLESEQTARALMNASPESALLVDAQGTALAANEITAQRLGTTIHRLIGANIYQYLPSQVAERRQAHIDQVVQTSRPARFEDERLGRWYDNYVHPIFDADGNVSRLAVFGHDITEHKQAGEQAQRLAALEERQRLARELHDSLSQALYGIGLGAHTALTWLDNDRGKVVEALDYVLSLADAGLTEMRALIFELRPESLALEGLVKALTRQAAAVYARNRIRVNLRLCGEPDLPLEAKEAIYRIAQEALHNAVKHSQAEQFGLRLECGRESVTLEVSDNGVGFDPAQSYGGHLGLLSMHERAARLGGALEIDSAPGQGTRIRVQLPSLSAAPCSGAPHL